MGVILKIAGATYTPPSSSGGGTTGGGTTGGGSTGGGTTGGGSTGGGSSSSSYSSFISPCGLSLEISGSNQFFMYVSDQQKYLNETIVAIDVSALGGKTVSIDRTFVSENPDYIFLVKDTSALDTNHDIAHIEDWIPSQWTEKYYSWPKNDISDYIVSVSERGSGAATISQFITSGSGAKWLLFPIDKDSSYTISVT